MGHWVTGFCRVFVSLPQDWYEAFFFSISVAVGLTPEMLPMIVTANLARGAVCHNSDAFLSVHVHQK